MGLRPSQGQIARGYVTGNQIMWLLRDICENIRGGEDSVCGIQCHYADLVPAHGPPH